MKVILAGREHEAALRALTRSLAMPGWIRIRFQREPDYFHGLGVQGRFNQVIVGVDGEELVGMGCRSIRPFYVNGEPRDLGYLHGLRSLEPSRRISGVARGFRFLRELHQDRRAPAYLTTIVEGNRPALDTLTGDRADLPRYLDRGRYVAYAININRFHRAGRHPADVEVERGTESVLPGILDFLRVRGARRQFFPALERVDFTGDLMRDFRGDDFYVARQGGAMVGVAARWDQRRFKQVVVDGYAGTVRTVRPIANGLLRAAGFQPMPPPGGLLSVFFVSWVCVANDDPRVLSAILDAMLRDSRGADYHFMIVGFHERDPLREAVRGFLAFRYVSRLYLVCWEDGERVVRSLDPSRVPYLEPAIL